MVNVLDGDWRVDFRFENKKLRAAIIGGSQSSDIQYAFYLMRGCEPVQKVWYSGVRMVEFLIPKIGGEYRVDAFLKRLGSKNISRKSSALLILQGSVLYDLEQWKAPLHIHDTIRGWSSVAEPVNGVHRFPSGSGYIDIRADGMAHLKESGSVLVCFGGAVTARTRKTAPFFTGLGVAAKAGLPVLAVSDPSLALSNSLALAWYAGNKGMPELPKDIAQVLDSFSKRFGVINPAI